MSELTQREKDLGYCEEAQTYCSVAEERYKQGWNDCMNDDGVPAQLLDMGYAKGKADAEEEHKAMCETCIHKVSAKDIEQIRADAIEECIDKFAEIMSNMKGICGRGCPVDCDWGTEETCKKKCKQWLKEQIK